MTVSRATVIGTGVCLVVLLVQGFLLAGLVSCWHFASEERWSHSLHSEELMFIRGRTMVGDDMWAQ